MKSIQPFRAIRYNPKKTKVSDIICPPYDVIDESLVKKLSKQSKYNSIFLSYNVTHKEGSDKYSHVAKLIKELKSKEILLKDPKPSFYFLEETFKWKGKLKTRRGIFALVPVLKNKNIIPHEKVFPDAVSDRLELLKSTKAHISPILLVYEDKNKKFENFLSQTKKTNDLVKIQYGIDKINYKFGSISDSKSIAELQRILQNKPLLIGDGHHRFATAQRYAKLKGKEQYILAFISPSKGMIFSYHKVLSTILDSNKVTTEQILKVCKKGDLLPQKSTYFYPKVMTGFVFHEL